MSEMQQTRYPCHQKRKRWQTAYALWHGIRSGEDGGSPIILYKYAETRAGDNAVEFLSGFKGYLMCDGYSGYNKIQDARRTACWAHVRRYLTDAIPKDKQLDYAQPAVQGMIYINQLFQLEDGRCSFSNNLSENAIRPFPVGRKNWLFCDTPNGAQASAIVYTMVEMAKANGVNVYHYLTYLLEKLPNDSMDDEELELLAPWNESVKAEIQKRAENTNDESIICELLRYSSLL